MKGLRANKRILLGITGSFGSGKSTVARIFKSFGAKIIDADAIAHRIMRPRTCIYKKIIAAFGRKGIINKDRTINRRQLAKAVFNDKGCLQALNAIVHPEIIRIVKKKIKSSPGKVVVLDAPLLIEAGLQGIVDKLLVVTITRGKQLERLRKKTALARSDILKRLKAEIPLQDKASAADFIIDNSGTINGTKKQVDKIRRLLWKN